MSNSKISYCKPLLTALLAVISSMLAMARGTNNEKGFVALFNGKDFEGWHLKLKNGDAEEAKEIYAIEDGMIYGFKHMPDSLNLFTGENPTHGLFYTNKKYGKYIVRFEYKWGNKITNNFDILQYDAGYYSHVTDDKIWSVGFEYQIRYDYTKDKNHTGDFGRPVIPWIGTQATAKLFCCQKKMVKYSSKRKMNYWRYLRQHIMVWTILVTNARLSLWDMNTPYIS